MTSVQLVRPPFNMWYENVPQLTDLVAPPIGLSIIAKNIRDAHDVEIIDGLGKPVSYVTDQLSADLVGVSALYANYERALEILESAKQGGATTVIGGPSVNYLAERILTNHSFVDYAVVGDGEVAVPALLAGQPPEQIPNLVYRAGTIRRNPFQRVPVTAFDLEDVVDLDLQTDNFLPISSIRGCVKAELEGRCSYCMIDTKFSVMRPELVWEQIGVLHDMYGVTRFWETGDTFMVGTFPQQLLEIRPSELEHVGFRVYTSPQQITPESARILKQLNAIDIFLGVESGNDEILEQANRGHTVQQAREAIALLDWPGMKLHLPFIYGLPGETRETAERTYRFAQEASADRSALRVISSLALPFPGSKLFENCREHIAAGEHPGDLDNDDVFNYRDLTAFHLKHFTEVELEDMLAYVDKTMALVQSEGNVTSYDINRE